VDGFWYDAYNNVTWYPQNDYPWTNGHPYDITKSVKYDAATFQTNYFYKRDMVAFVHGLNPNLATFVNNFKSIIPADVVGHERKRGNYKMSSPDGPVDLWHNENLLIPAGTWYYNGRCGPVTNQMEVKRVVDSIASGCIATLAEGPYVNGDFPPSLNSYNRFLSRFFNWAGESLFAPAIPGGHGQGGLPAGDWNDGAYGLTTFIPGKDIHYLHVLAAPSGHTLTIPDAGCKIVSARNLKTRTRLAFTQAGGNLSITVPDWSLLNSDGDYIIKLEAVPDYAGF
jgi:hypothetical protein